MFFFSLITPGHFSEDDLHWQVRWVAACGTQGTPQTSGEGLSESAWERASSHVDPWVTTKRPPDRLYTIKGQLCFSLSEEFPAYWQNTVCLTVLWESVMIYLSEKRNCSLCDSLQYKWSVGENFTPRSTETEFIIKSFCSWGNLTIEKAWHFTMNVSHIKQTNKQKTAAG